MSLINSSCSLCDELSIYKRESSLVINLLWPEWPPPRKRNSLENFKLNVDIVEAVKIMKMVTNSIKLTLANIFWETRWPKGSCTELRIERSSFELSSWVRHFTLIVPFLPPGL